MFKACLALALWIQQEPAPPRTHRDHIQDAQQAVDAVSCQHLLHHHLCSILQAHTQYYCSLSAVFWQTWSVLESLDASFLSALMEMC